MQTPQIDELTQRYVAAMVSAVLGQKLWQADGVTLYTPDELSAYLLLDVQDTAQTQATRTSSIVRTLQQHIESVYSGMEAGYEKSYIEPEDVQYWYEILSHYRTWSANVLLGDHASKFIDPHLRLNKTSLFHTLDNNLRQMRLSDASVKQGLMEYTQAFQRLCDLDVLSGYIDGPGIQKARYFLVGQERTAPFAYYLRSVNVKLANESERINPVDWEEWRKCEIATAGKVLDIRCVSWLGLPVLVWCEWIAQQVDSNGVVLSPWTLVIQLAFSSLNGQWLAPLTLHRQECEYDVSDGRLTVVSLGDGDPRDDRLAVCFTNRHGLDGQSRVNEIEIHETRDALFRKIADDIPTMLQNVFGRFKDAVSLQQKVLPEDYSAITITHAEHVPGTLTQHLYLDVVHTREKAGDGNFYEVLRVRGRCEAVEESGRVLQRMSISWRAVTPTASVEVRIVDAGEKQLRITLTTRKKPAQEHAVQLYQGSDAETLHTFAVDDFKETSLGDGIWEAEAVVTLSPYASTYLLSRTADEVRAGAGFSITGLGDAVLNEKNRLVPRILYALVDFHLDMLARTPQDPVAWVSTAELNGRYATPWRIYSRKTASRSVKNFPTKDPIDFVFGEAPTRKAYGSNKFSVLLNKTPRLYITPALDKNSGTGAQFLSFNNTDQTLKHVRLNSTLGPVLTSRASVSNDALLSWKTQHAKEPDGPVGTIEKNGPFDGCNALYFWEMFFHVPHLVGIRLSEEGRYHEGQRWFEYIFHPLAREIPADPNDPEVTPAPPFWRCRPLQNTEIECSYESARQTDPDAIGYCKPSHFKIAIFLHYVENLIKWGDSLYRQLDYDSMVHAGLNYSRAKSLIGEEPVTRTASTWEPIELGKLVEKIEGRDPLKTFENSLDFRLADIPTGMQEKPRLDLLGSGVFKAGLNERPHALWKLLDSRLNNLRNNRSIEGQPLALELFQPTMDPRDLLIAQANGNLGTSRNLGGQVQVIPYKWSSAYNLALQLVEFLIQQEEQLRTWLDKRDQNQLDELQQSHMIKLADYTREIFKATIAQAESMAASLRQSESMVEARAQYYRSLGEEGVSDAEYRAVEKNRNARFVAIGAGALLTASAVLRVIPNIFGTSNGGSDLGSVPDAGARVLQTTADAWRSEAEEESLMEQFRRRKQEWTHMLEQSDAETRVLRVQVQAQEHAINVARVSLQQAEMVNAQAKEVYAFYKNRSTGLELSNWMVGQLHSLMFQLYDLAVGQCRCAETCWQYEMGDFKARFIRTDAWMDAYRGLTAGAWLKLDLLRMAAARTKRDERRLQIVKNISLRELDPTQWKTFKTSGRLDINLNEKDFDRDYPGHYLRQVIECSLTFPGLLGPYQNIRATLVQISSSTVLEPKIETVKFLHGLSVEPVPGSLVQNLRPYQQIIFSQGLVDDGLPSRPDDDRYLPFEGTGAHGSYRFTLVRPNEPKQESLLKSLTDMIMTLTYQARDGGPEFAAAVEGLLTPRPDTLQTHTPRAPRRVRTPRS